MDELERLAGLIREQNRISGEIAALVQRPALAGHVGEFIAARVFDIQLAQSATQKSIDGHFNTGALAGRSVNVKWYGKREGLLDITPDALPDFYLVMCGPRGSAVSSRGRARPWCIESVHLFDAAALDVSLRSRQVIIGIATSVVNQLWREAEIYSEPTSRTYTVTEEQRVLLKLFSMQTAAILQETSGVRNPP
jgi:hypothetical protein